MFRCYLKTCSVPLEHVIRLNHCLQVFSDHVNSSRCHSIRSPLIPCAVCILLHDVLWMIMHHQKWSGRDEYLHKPLSVPVGQCDWGLSQSHFIPLVYGTIMIVVEKLDNQNLTALACQKNSALLLSFELDLVAWPDNWFEYSSKHQENISFSTAALPNKKLFLSPDLQILYIHVLMWCLFILVFQNIILSET